jgi:hypothetical protein
MQTSPPCHDAPALIAWREHRATLDRLLTDHAALLEAVRGQVQPLWQTLAAGKTFTRKPGFGLRLFAADGQTLVGIAPSYDRQTKTMDCGRLLVEVITDVERYLSLTSPTPFYQLARRLRLTIQDGKPPRWTQASMTAVAEMAVLVSILEQFVTDPPTVLRRSTSYCALCGRRLTDGQSRARGFGPECVRHLSTLWATSATLGMMLGRGAASFI